jgi:4-amino-4-deoxy-L-arabinose transferase-like glycosyltransferase
MSASTRAALIGALVAAIATLPGLGTGTLWDNSETAYGEVAREILLTHDWVVMHHNGLPWFVQPPLYFWIAALFAKAFGLTTLALRLPAALATIAMGAVTGYAATSLAGARVGVYGAVILSTSLMQVVIGRMAIMDALLDLAVAIGILALFRAFTGGRPVASVLGASIAIALGVLTKGPVAPLLVALVIIPWLAWERYEGTNLSRPPLWAWFAGAAVFIVIVAPWFGLLVARAGIDSISMLIGHYTFGRYLGTIENQSGPVWYYIPVVILGFFPWIAFLPGAIAVAWRSARTLDGLNVQVARLAMVWAIVPFVFFSFANTKLPNYVALELPALSLLVALWLDRVADGNWLRGALVATASIPLTIAACGIAIAIYAREAHLVAGTRAVLGDLLAMAAIVFAGSVLTFVLIWRRRADIAPYAFGATTIVMVAYTAIVAEPHTERFKPVPQLAAVIREDGRSGDVVAIQGAGGNSLIFYTQPHVYEIGDGPRAKQIVCEAKRAFVVTPLRYSGIGATYERPRHVIASAANDLLYLYDGAPCAAVGSTSLR